MKKLLLNDTVVLTDEQLVIDQCKASNIPVAGLEPEGATKHLRCEYIFTSEEDITEADLRLVFARTKGLPMAVLETDRCFVRELCMSDIDDLFALYDNPGVTTYMEPLFEYDEEVAYEEQYIKLIYGFYGIGQWLVFDKKTKALIGRAGIEIRETCTEGQAELGYLIRPDLWRQGLAFEVCQAIVKYGFEQVGLESIIARTDPENVASVRLLEKLGFGYENLLENGDLKYCIFNK